MGNSQSLDDASENMIKNMVTYSMLPAGTLLYRTVPVDTHYEILHARLDPDTGKSGLYFSTTQVNPIGMILEYNKPMILCTYKLLTPIILVNGKYANAFMFPKLYFNSLNHFKNYMNDKAKPNIVPEDLGSWNHIDFGIYPIHEYFNREEWWNDKQLSSHADNEVFITEDELPSVMFIKQKLISIPNAKSSIRKIFKKRFEKTLPK